MSIRRRGLSAALLAVLFVAGCGDTSASPGSGAAATPSSSLSVPSGVSVPSVPSGAVETISGTVEAGVEPNCLLLQGAGKPRLLFFDDPALKARAKVGATVTVVGTAKPGQMTTCQQGTPFFVTSVTTARAGS